MYDEKDFPAVETLDIGFVPFPMRVAKKQSYRQPRGFLYSSERTVKKNTTPFCLLVTQVKHAVIPIVPDVTLCVAKVSFDDPFAVLPSCRNRWAGQNVVAPFVPL